MTFYASTKSFMKKRHFIWDVQKRQIQVFQNDFVRDFFSFLYRSRKMSFRCETFCDNIKMSRCISEISFGFFKF